MPGARTQRVIAVASAFALLVATLVLLFRTEPIAARFWFAIAVTVAIASLVVFLTRRLLFASVVTSSVVAVVFLVSLEKQATMNMGLHSYDLFFYLNADTFEFLWGDYRRYVIVVLAAVAAATTLAALTWRFDTTRLSPLVSGLTLVAAVSVAGAFEPQASAEGGAFRLFTQNNSFVSAFYLSWSETWGTLVRGQLMEAAARTALPDFASDVPMHAIDEAAAHRAHPSRVAWCRPVCFPGSNMTALLTGFSIPTMAGFTGCAWKHTEEGLGSPSLRC